MHTPLHAPRLKKLLLMLSSDRDGEVLNAARAIGKMLREHGADWHDLVGGFLALEGPQNDDDYDWLDAQEYCLGHLHLLRPREREFIVSLNHWRGRLTPKQSDWLSSLYMRLQQQGGAS